MARMDGITAVRGIAAINPAIPVVIMTAYSSVETAVEALRLGAYDYLSKPLDFDLLRHTLHRAVEHTRLATENAALRRLAGAQGRPFGLLGHSRVMTELVDLVETIAPTDATVLIHGPSGTGKELIARAIWSCSRRGSKPLVTLNCAALSESLLESELFGHERGAFTGADKRREGRFKQADGGTLFLDEIGELPPALQAAFLRVLQHGEIQRVGSDAVSIVDVRIIAATNRDLLEAVRLGTFREDLYYRLNVIGVEAPSLRERREDIPLLAAAFLERFAAANRKKIRGFSPQAMDALTRHDWPGNVRELENAVERAVILCAGECVIGCELPAPLAGMCARRETAADEAREAPPVPAVALEELERMAVAQTLRLCGDNKSDAARRLGISRATLHNKLKRYGLE
jgi:two-component system response regulator HydG